MARFDGRVHGVVVQISASAPSSEGGPAVAEAAAPSGADSRSPTVTAGSLRSR